MQNEFGAWPRYSLLTLINIFYNIIQNFLFTFSYAIRLGNFPTILKSGKNIFILITCRNPEDTSSYRPIVMNSLFGNILERLLISRLYFFLQSNNLFENNIFNFTSGRSALLAFHALKERLQQKKQLKIPLMLIFLYLKGTYDSVWHPLVLAFFQRHGCPRNVYHLLTSFLNDRKIVYKTNVSDVNDT